MNAQNIDKKPVVKRESKNKIRVDFDRSPLKDRIKAKIFNFYFLSRIVLWIFRLVLMIGISYIVLFPFISKIAGSVMAPQDFVDATVRLIPKNFSLDIYKAIFTELGYWEAFMNTFTLSFSCAILQTFVCCLIGYGFAKFKFRGRNLIFLLVMLTMIVPHQTLQLSMFMQFRYFDILGIVKLLKGGGIELFGFNLKDISEGAASFFENLNVLPNEIKWGYYVKNDIEMYKVQMELTEAGINLINTSIPLILLSLGGLAFKNGLYIFLLRQFFRGIPDELEESAYMDGSGTFRTFIQIILPLSVPMMITVFLFAFCWQWTDDFYTKLFMPNSPSTLLVDIVEIPSSLKMEGMEGYELYYSAIRNTCGLLIILPLVILYAFCQRFLVQGIEQSGLAN